MSFDIRFQGPHIFNNGSYPENVNTQSKAVLKAMGRHVDINYSLVNTAGLAQDLANIGFSIDSLPSSTKSDVLPSLFLDEPYTLPIEPNGPKSDLASEFANGVNNMVNDLIRRCYDDAIIVEQGFNVFRNIAQHTLNNQISQYESNFFSSSQRSEGKYFSYQLTFYSMKKGSYCFLVMSFVSFRDTDYIFGIPVSVRTGLSCRGQIFPCRKVVNSFLYNPAILRSGQHLASPNGQYQASLSSNGNFSVGSRWQSGVPSGGRSPFYLKMQEDGNLVIYDANNNPTWASGRYDSGWPAGGPYWVELHDDGRLVVYKTGGANLWSV